VNDVASSLGLGPPYHVGIAVRDLDDGIRRFSDLIGLDGWATLDADVPAVYRGAESVAGIRSAFARSGGLMIELVQPTGGLFTAKTFLEERGEGIYHLGYLVQDMTSTLDRAAALGIGVDWQLPSENGPLAVYLDSTETMGIHLELVAPAMVRVVTTMLEKAKPPEVEPHRSSRP
jgi:catechol 2,3-dioxygenase-like lactoylglutathione lyase family enzyme